MAEQDAQSIVAPGWRWSWTGSLVWLGAVGAALMTYASQLVWAYDLEAQNFPGQGALPPRWSPWIGHNALYPLLIPLFGLGSNVPYYIELIWRVALPAGVALALALGVWRTSRLAAVAYVVWLAFVTTSVAAIAYTLFGRSPAALCQVNCDYLEITAVRPANGLWLTLAAVALLWIAAGAWLASWRATRTPSPQLSLASVTRALRTPERLAALVFTSGALVWVFGFIFVPWATQGCTGFPINWAHFVSGSCAGLDANDALGAGWSVGVLSNQMYLALGGLTGLVMMVALIAVWQRGWFPPVIAAIWAALATWLTMLALTGLPVLLKNPPGLSVSTAPWVTGAGPAVTEAGLVVVWVGAAVIYWGFVSQMRKRLRAGEPVERASLQ